MPATGKYVGRNRAQAFWRIVALVLYGSVGWILGTIAILAALLWMLVDVVLQLVLNSGGWSKGGRGSEWLERLYYWQIDILDWILFGSGSFPWLP